MLRHLRDKCKYSNRFSAWIAWLCCYLLLSSCAMGPDYLRPQVEVTEKFRVSHAEGKSIANLAWWELFHDENLQRLINQALSGNKELKQAEASIEEMQARLRIAFMDVFQHPIAILDGPP